MGRTTSEPQKETPTGITHFGHPHPLIHITTDHRHKITRNISSYSSCSGCNLNIFGTNFYACTDCKFFLHKKCFDMPKKIEHPFHKDHALSLVPGPAYSTGNFNCDACFEKGKGFSYNCDPCGIDLHILCAIMPLCVTNATCHPHKLDLTFGSPFLTKRFSCNVCKKLGGDHWLYRCGLCGFDAHLKCVMSFQSKDYLEPREVATFSKWAPATPPPVVAALPLMVAPPPLVEKASPPMVAAPPPNVATPSPIVAVLPPVVAVPPDLTQKLRARPVMESVPCVLPVEVSSVPSTRVGNGHSNDLALFAIQQMITNNSKAIAQAILSAGNSGDIRGFHLLIELIYAISSNSGTSGGGSQDSLHTINNNGGGNGNDGGGDGQDSLQMVIDCGSDGDGPDRALHKVIEDSGGVGGQKSLHAVNDRGGGQESSYEVMDDGCDVGGGRDSQLPAIKIDGGGSGGQDSLQAVVREHGGGHDSLQTVMEIGGGGGGDNLPEKITHPFDGKHVLTLLSEPAYGEGRFQCDACSERGKGYSYHCQPCGIYLHAHCAMLPLSVTHGSHVHKLNLTFESPYPEKKFSCDICTSIGSCQWLYTCKSCGFDAHVKCVTTEDDAPPAHTPSKSIEPTKRRQEVSAAPMKKIGFPEAQVSVNVPRFGVGRQNSGLTAIQQMKINDNRANTAMAQGLMGLVRISNSVISGDGGYQQSLIGDGNGINFLAGLFEG